MSSIIDCAIMKRAKREYRAKTILRFAMEIDHCVFPDSLLYDSENNTWANALKTGEVTLGITSLLAAIAGRLTSFRPKPIGSVVAKGSSLATLENERFVGPVPSPLTGIILATNEQAAVMPKLVNDSPYSEGWIARIRPTKLVEEAPLLSSIQDVQGLFRQRIVQYHVRCFKAFPDQELYEIGVECSAVLMRLNELISSLPIGVVVHLVSDDPTAYVEMVRWADMSGQTLVDWRTDGNLFHFIVRKVKSSHLVP